MKNQCSNENIGKRIAQLRKRQNLTQAALAEQIGATSKHISEIERGVTGISIDMQVQLSEKLFCSLDYLIKGKEFESVDSLIPPYIVDILHSQDEAEKALLLEYLKIYEKISKKQ